MKLYRSENVGDGEEATCVFSRSFVPPRLPGGTLLRCRDLDSSVALTDYFSSTNLRRVFTETRPGRRDSGEAVRQCNSTHLEVVKLSKVTTCTRVVHGPLTHRPMQMAFFDGLATRLVVRAQTEHVSMACIQL